MKYLVIILVCLACSAKPPRQTPVVSEIITIPDGFVLPDSGLVIPTGTIMALPGERTRAIYIPSVKRIDRAEWADLFKARKIKNSPVTVVVGDSNTLDDLGKVKEKESTQTTTNSQRWMIWAVAFIVFAFLIFVIFRSIYKG